MSEKQRQWFNFIGSVVLMILTALGAAWGMSMRLEHRLTMLEAESAARIERYKDMAEELKSVNVSMQQVLIELNRIAVKVDKLEQRFGANGAKR